MLTLTISDWFVWICTLLPTVSHVPIYWCSPNASHANTTSGAATVKLKLLVVTASCASMRALNICLACLSSPHGAPPSQAVVSVIIIKTNDSNFILGLFRCWVVGRKLFQTLRLAAEQLVPLTASFNVCFFFHFLCLFIGFLLIPVLWIRMNIHPAGNRLTWVMCWGKKKKVNTFPLKLVIDLIIHTCD